MRMPVRSSIGLTRYQERRLWTMICALVAAHPARLDQVNPLGRGRFTILSACRAGSGLPLLPAGFGSLVIGLENGSCWISKSAVSAEPFASTLVHLSDSAVTLIAEN
jgi:hypothetical protein